MPRIRQQYPQNYGSNSAVHADFENIIRYLNAAEIGDKTLGELMATLFNEDGKFDGPIEFRFNTATGLEYRVGEYPNSEDGWILVTAATNIRGPAGQNVGQIDGPFFFNRQDFIATSGQTVFSYTHNATTEDLMVLKNGVLLRASGSSPPYTKTGTAVTLASGAALNDVITIITLRASAVSNYRRTDYVAVTTVPVIGFAHTDDERLLVYKNGLLLREGGSLDYVKSSVSDTITFNTPLESGDVATIMTVENKAQTNVAGLMFEDEYTNSNGFILYNKLVIANNEIPQIKVDGLAAALASKAKVTISATTPITPSTGDLWVDTSQNPELLKFYSGTQWLATSPDSNLPTYNSGNAGQYLRVNGTATAYELGDIDFSALIPKTFSGAANGVASLDSSGKIPTGQLPDIFSVDTIDAIQAGSISNGTYRLKTIYRQKIRIDGISIKTSAGTCTVQIAVDGVTVGTTYAASSTRTNTLITPAIEIDALTAGRVIQIVVTSNSSGADLDVALAVATLNT